MRLMLMLVVALWAGMAGARELSLTFGTVPVRVWLPDGQAEAPLILFSHSFGGCPAQSEFLTRGLARAGYIVAAPEHGDHACGWPGKPQVPFRYPELWEPYVYLDRLQDMQTVLAGLRAGSRPWMGRIDWDRVGLMGHSLGGYTVLGMAGAVPGWKTPGIRSVLALSPYCTPFIYRGGLQNVDIPIEMQGGSVDRPITPTVKRPGGCYDLAPSPAWYVEIDRAWHLSWTGITFGRTHRVIVRAATEFFDATLNGQGTVQHRPGMSDFRSK